MTVQTQRSARRLVVTAFALACAQGLEATRALAQSAGTPVPLPAGLPTSDHTLARAQAALAADRLIEAQSLLRELVKGGAGSALGASQQSLALELLQRTDKRISQADVVEMSLQRAAWAVDQADLRVAERHVKAVLARGTLAQGQRERAVALQTTIEQRRMELTPIVAGMLSRAVTDFGAQRFAEARTGLSTIQRSGVALDDDERATLERLQLRLVEIEQNQGKSFGAADVSLAMMQPGTVRRNPPAEPPPAPATSPATSPTPEPAPEGQPASPARGEQPATEQMPAAAPTPEPAAAAPAPGEDLVTVAMRVEAQRLVAEGEAAFAEGRYSEAARKLELATISGKAYLSADELRSAQTKLDEARARLRSGVGGGALADRTVQNIALIRERAVAEFENELERASKAVAAGDTTQASDLLARAGLTMSQARQYFSQAEYDGYVQRLDTARQQAAATGETIRAKELSEREVMLRRKADEAQRSLATEKDRKVREAVIRARALQAEQKYGEALQVIDQVLFLEPNNPTGLLLRDVLSDIIAYRKADEIYRLRQRGFQAIRLDAAASAVPPVGMMNFPPDWPNKSFSRGDGAAFAEAPENRRAMAALERRVPAEFAGNKLADVLQYVRQVAGVDVDVDWESLRNIGIDAESPVELSLTDKPVSVVLQRTLAKVSKDQFAKADYAVQDGIVTIASEDSLKKHVVSQPYNITDLLLDAPNYTDVPDMDLGRAIARAANPEITDGPFTKKYGRDTVAARDERVRKLVSLIQTTVATDSWRDRGGETGSMQELNGSLIITTTPSNHREIASLLSQLRDVRSLQVNCESRFLLVNQDFFEQIGFDLDVYFNAGSNQFETAALNDDTLLLSDFFDPTTGRPQRAVTGGPSTIPQTGGAGPATSQGLVRPDSWTPVSAAQNSLGLTEALAGGVSPFASSILAAAPALGIAGQFMDDIQVDFLIKATQADQRSSTLTAPRLTLTNGQISNIFIARQASFVSDLTPIVGESAVGFDPVPGVLTTGVVLAVEPVISADRRYVTINVDTSVSQADPNLRTIGVSAVAGGAIVGSAATGSFIELPTINTTRVQTTVTVPDEGTVLLGGQRIIAEVEVETGVPVLSKLPIINRFFTNRVSAKTESTLLILIKPTILISSEEEERQFPGLLDSMRTGVGG
ncbi:MAG: hypothetical protein ACKVS8_09335 [Phycisphaerales bacterium]